MPRDRQIVKTEFKRSVVVNSSVNFSRCLLASGKQRCCRLPGADMFHNSQCISISMWLSSCDRRSSHNRLQKWSILSNSVEQICHCGISLPSEKGIEAIPKSAHARLVYEWGVFHPSQWPVFIGGKILRVENSQNILLKRKFYSLLCQMDFQLLIILLSVKPVDLCRDTSRRDRPALTCIGCFAGGVRAKLRVVWGLLFLNSARRNVENGSIWILCIADSNMRVQRIAGAIRKAGYNVVISSSSHKAVALAAMSIKLDAVVIDEDMVFGEGSIAESIKAVKLLSVLLVCDAGTTGAPPAGVDLVTSNGSQQQILAGLEKLLKKPSLVASSISN